MSFVSIVGHNHQSNEAIKNLLHFHKIETRFFSYVNNWILFFVRETRKKWGKKSISRYFALFPFDADNISLSRVAMANEICLQHFTMKMLQVFLSIHPNYLAFGTG